MDEEKPTYITKTGQEAKGAELSDLQEYNSNLKHNTERLNYQSKILKFGIVVVAVIGGGFLSLSLYVLYQIMYWDLFTGFLEALK